VSAGYTRRRNVGLCEDGTQTCANQAWGECEADVTPAADVCNGDDDDCDPTAADGSGDSRVGEPCDGPDGDLCSEGTGSCDDGSFACDDATGDHDDCDPASPDGSEDPQNGVTCDGADGDACLEGTRTCSGGGFVCSDNTGTNGEVCNGLDDDCDGIADDGVVRNDNPLCSDGTFYLGSMSGDTGAAVFTDSRTDEEWDRFTLTENNSSIFESVYLSATVTLQSAPGTDFDLYVYCNNCSGAVVSSTNGAGQVDTVSVRTNDDSFQTDDMDVVVEVRHFNSSVCAVWTLTVTGNTPVATETCN